MPRGTMRSLLLGLLLVACAPPPAANHPPALTHDPVTVGQGEGLSVALAPTDPDGDPVTVSLVSATTGLGAALAADGVTLTLHADYTLVGAQQVKLHLDDGAGAGTDVTLTVNVTALGWQWTAMADATGPTAREHGTFVLDADHDVAYLLGGSGYAPQSVPAVDAYWKLDLTTRTFTALPTLPVQPPPAASRRVANLADKKIAYLFGGYDSATTDVNDLYSFDYSQEPPVFALIPQVNAPPARELHAFGYDPGTDTFVVFGGYSGETGLLSDTWTMKLSGGVATWTKIVAPGPSARYGFFFAMDPSTGRLFLWSGAQQPTSLDPIHAAQDVWMLDLRASSLGWLRLLAGTEPNTPVGRRNGAFVFDPTGPRLFVFGGTADGQTTVQDGVNVLDLSGNTPAWVALTPANMPPLRSSDFGFYDTKRGQAVMGFGNDRAVYRDVFALGY